ADGCAVEQRGGVGPGESLEISAALGDEGLVGCDDMPAAAECSLDEFAGGFRAADEFDDDVGGAGEGVEGVGREQIGGDVYVALGAADGDGGDFEEVRAGEQTFVDASADDAAAEEADAEGVAGGGWRGELVGAASDERCAGGGEGCDFDFELRLAGPVEGFGLDEAGACAGGGLPAHALVAACCGGRGGVGGVDARDIFDQHATGPELLGEEDGGEVGAAAAEEGEAPGCAVGADEAGGDDDGCSREGGVECAAVEAGGLGIAEGAAGGDAQGAGVESFAGDAGALEGEAEEAGGGVLAGGEEGGERTGP